MAVEITKENFDQEVLQASLPVLLDFWGPRCGNCLALMPTVDALEEQYGQSLKVAKLDASQNRRLCMNLQVMKLPTFLIFRNGQEVERILGEMTPAQLRKKVEAFLENEQ